MNGILLILIGVILTMISLPYALLTVLQVSWSTTHPYLQWIVLLLVILVYVWIWMNIIHYALHKKLLKIKAQLLICSGIVLCLVIVLVTNAYDAWQHRYETISAEVNLEDYLPNQSEKLAVLDKASDLKLSEPLPVMDGATALYPIYAAFAQAVYPDIEYPVYNSKVMCSTTPYAYENLLHKQADIIFAAAPSEKQKAMFTEAKEELVLTPIGKEGFVFFVNKENPINELSIQQIQDIYQGKITNWKQVGGEDEEIRAFQRPEGSGSQSALLRLMDGLPLMKAIEEDVPSGMGDIISQTAEYQNRPNALGFSFRFYANEMVKNDKIKLLSINGITPDAKHIRDESYPITNSFYAVTLKSNTNEKVDQLLQWMVSDQGKELIEKTGYVSE